MKVLAAYETIRKKLLDEDRQHRASPPIDLYSFETVRYTLNSRTATKGNLEDLLQAFPADQGWICRQSRLSVFQKADDRPTDTNNGIILSAELVAPGGKRSLHVRQDGMGGWLLTEMHEGEGDREGLAHTASLIGSHEMKGWLCYRVYWEHDDGHGWQTKATRLFQIHHDPQWKNNPCKEI